MEESMHTEFSQRAIQRVSVVFREVVDDRPLQYFLNLKWLQSRGIDAIRTVKRQKRLSELMSCLETISQNLVKYEQSEHEWGLEAMDRTETLLRELELACTFSTTTRAQNEVPPFPTLKTLLDQEATPLHVAQSLKKFASKTRNTQRLLNVLKSFDRTQEQARKEAERAQQHRERGGKLRAGENKKLADEDESYPERIYDMIRKFVQNFAICHCDSPHPDPKAPKRHWGRLELKERCLTNGDDIVFHTVYSKEASVDFVNAVQWQHLQLHVARWPKNRHRGPHFASEDSDGSSNVLTSDDNGSEPSPETNKSPIASESEFCKLLRRPVGPASFNIKIMDTVSECDTDTSGAEFVNLNWAGKLELKFSDERSTSLAEVLNCGELGPGQKLRTAYVLAKSVWQFYASDWINCARWTSDFIQLFRAGDDANVKKATFDWAPYFPFSVEGMPPEECKERLNGMYIHNYPRVLALGALLYELGLTPDPDRRMEPKIDPVSLEEKINTMTDTIQRGLEEWDLNGPDLGVKNLNSLQEYRLVVATCVDENIFKPDPADETTEAYKNERVKVLTKTRDELEQELSIEDRRAVLYRKIVVPLREILQGAGWLDENGYINRRKAKQPAASRWEAPSASLLTNRSGSQSALPGGQDDAAARSSKNAAEWLKTLKSSNVMRRVVTAFDTLKQLEGERIRIAVLDTGYDPQAVFFNRVRALRIKRWKDYVERGQSKERDEDGHGTHVLSVLMQVAPAADIYVARIARNTEDLSKSSENVADAIKWAWDECKANIITMSFGFHDEQYVDGKPVISNAISAAHTGRSQCILFFAAAANDGGNRDEMFPARSKNVISIRGTDDRGWMQSFNPPTDFNSETCFMTLGVDVPGASLTTGTGVDGGGMVCRSGTSVATPIAAGLAALVLGYAKIYGDEAWCLLKDDEKDKRFNIEKISGMTAFFRKLATEMMHKWSYLHIEDFEGKRHELRLADIANAARETKG